MEGNMYSNITFPITSFVHLIPSNTQTELPHFFKYNWLSKNIVTHPLEKVQKKNNNHTAKPPYDTDLVSFWWKPKWWRSSHLHHPLRPALCCELCTSALAEQDALLWWKLPHSSGVGSSICFSNVVLKLTTLMYQLSFRHS